MAFNAGKTQLVSVRLSNDTGAMDVKIDGSVLEKISSFKMLGMTFSSKLDWGSIAKTALKKIEALIFLMKFLSLEVALYLYIPYAVAMSVLVLHFPILKEGLLVILIDCTIFLSPFLDITRMPMSTVSFLTHLDSGILCI